jgi:hypothetical protein
MRCFWRCLAICAGLVCVSSCGTQERLRMMNDLRQVGMAVLYCQNTGGSFPAAAICDASGKPLLSWRVALLPYLEAQSLYQQFHLDEPWDSEHNKRLIQSMPDVYRSKDDPEDGKTRFVALVGENGIFTGKPKGTTAKEVPDGVSNTIIVVEANPDRRVPWTKPEDISFDPQRPLAGLGEACRHKFLVLTADGAVHTMSKDVSPETFRAMQTASGKEAFQWPSVP